MKERIRYVLKRRSPFGKESWIKTTTTKLGLSSTLNPRGRPKKGTLTPFLLTSFQTLAFLNELVYYVRVTKKQHFLIEHNRLSPENLQATTSLLSHFRTERASLFKDNNWSVDKLRRPFVLWLTSLAPEEKEKMSQSTN